MPLMIMVVSTEDDSDNNDDSNNDDSYNDFQFHFPLPSDESTLL